jgi:serine/threonine-protein kinase
MSVTEDVVGGAAGVLDDRYELGTELGRGATGVVWEARDRVTSDVVAVKVLHKHLLASMRARKRFVREARSAARLNHPHSVVVEGHACVPGGEAYLVMERLVGVTLATVLQGDRPLTQPRAIRIIAQVLDAAAAAHRLNVLHRDLKPNNVMLIDRGGDPDFVKVCDFGLAKELDTGALSSQLTDHGQICGTPAYMAPEQARGEQLDARADIYSVAVMLFQAVVGRLPFQASSPFALASLHLSAPPPRPGEIRPDIAFFPALESLILRALSKDKAQRPSSAEVFRADLLQIERDYQASGWESAGGRGRGSQMTDTLQPVDDARRRRGMRRLIVVGGFLLTASVAGVIGASTWTSRDRADLPKPAAVPTPTDRAAYSGAAATPTPAPPPPLSQSATGELSPMRVAAPRANRGTKRFRATAAPEASAAAAKADDPERSLAAAEERLTAGHVAEACALGQVMAASAPQEAAIWEFLGRCYMRLPDPRQARAYYRRYLALAPGSPNAPFIRAIVEQAGP